MHHRQCCVSILFVALSLHVKPSPWCHTKANTKYVCTCVCASSVHFNLVYVFPPILAFLLSHSSSLFCYESSCVYFDDEFHMTDISCSHQKVPLGRGCQPKITVGVFSTVLLAISACTLTCVLHHWVGLALFSFCFHDRLSFPLSSPPSLK